MTISTGSPSNVISLMTRKLAARNGETPSHSDKGSRTRVISISSGKGGVGKTNIVANLGISLSRLGKKVMIFDADLGLGNLDILLGLTPKYNFSHVILGEKTLSEIIVEGPCNIKILPASSGIQEMANLSKEQTACLLSDLYEVIDPIDILLIDTAAGISSNVMYFNAMAHEVLVVVSSEPTSITDAYALIKILSIRYDVKHFKLLVNMVSDIQEAHEVYRQLKMVSERFLDITIEYIGHVTYDKNVGRGVRQQKAVCDLYPDTPASRCFGSLAVKLCQVPMHKSPSKNTRLFWKELISNKQDFIKP
jgi:flagellar biosynthesis protein FlhG